MKNVPIGYSMYVCMHVIFILYSSRFKEEKNHDIWFLYSIYTHIFINICDLLFVDMRHLIPEWFFFSKFIIFFVQIFFIEHDFLVGMTFMKSSMTCG